MTDREKMLGLLNGNDRLNSLEDILDYYLHIFEDEISARQLSDMMRIINNLLACKVRELDRMKRTSKERATYLKAYLSGELWLTEEAAKENVQPQIDNAQAIIDACNNV